MGEINAGQPDLNNNLQIDEIKMKIDRDHITNDLFGNLDVNLRILRDNYDVEVVQRQDEIILKGGEAGKARELILELLGILEAGEKLDPQLVNYVISLHQKGLSYHENNVNKDVICFTHKGKPVKAKTIGQADYAKNIREHEAVFGIGPAGTGKTYLAVAMAINAFKNKEVEKIVLARPAVEAGERLGFLPGDLQEKVDPYLRPLYDALYEMMGRDATLRLKERESIEVVPLAYMRGRTLDRSFIILDEAQNTTKEQMKMFLTRLGLGSKAVITGDVTQIDLPRGKRSGLKHAVQVLSGVPEIRFCFLKENDVVRHALVRKIVAAYDRYENDNPESDAEGAWTVAPETERGNP
ncbi:MAG: PhoH family protein [Clostridiales Family XIII bacterium]|jgi:phosphate starvation-inducible PhoH-like protein|nr:PhoH family protein [Clostridiales Family XIII bacterium]